jgi:hypothetical protein
MSTSTGPPAARARSLGARLDTKGTDVASIAAPPAAPVAASQRRRSASSACRAVGEGGRAAFMAVSFELRMAVRRLRVRGAGLAGSARRACTHCTRSPALVAPLRRASSWPPWNSTSVGMLRMPWARLACGLASVSTLAKRTCGMRRAASSKCGAIVRQGPHQGAQKSTSTGTSLRPTKVGSTASSSGAGCGLISSVLQRPQTG